MLGGGEFQHASHCIVVRNTFLALFRMGGVETKRSTFAAASLKVIILLNTLDYTVWIRAISNNTTVASMHTTYELVVCIASTHTYIHDVLSSTLIMHTVIEY